MQILELALIIKTSCEHFNDRINSSVPSTGLLSINPGLSRLLHKKGNPNAEADSSDKAWSGQRRPL